MRSSRIPDVPRRGSRLLVAVALLCAAPAGLAGPAAAQPSCTPMTLDTVVPPTIPVMGWSENLGFDALGNLWVSRVLGDVVERYDHTGRRTAAVPVRWPGAVRMGPDGLMYVVSGTLPLNMLPGLRNGSVVRFDPAADNPVPEPFSTGLGMPNGLGFDTEDHAYVADSSLGVLRLRPDGRIDTAWTAAAPKNMDLTHEINGATINGLVVVDDAVYITVTASPTGRVVRIPIDAPQQATTVTDLIPAAGAALPDDLTALGGNLVVATTLGQVAEVEPVTGRACTVWSGEPLTALAANPTRPGELVAATELGDVVYLRPKA
jgi:virginiamycin B lyase